MSGLFNVCLLISRSDIRVYTWEVLKPAFDYDAVWPLAVDRVLKKEDGRKEKRKKVTNKLIVNKSKSHDLIQISQLLILVARKPHSLSVGSSIKTWQAGKIWPPGQILRALTFKSTMNTDQLQCNERFIFILSPQLLEIKVWGSLHSIFK